MRKKLIKPSVFILSFCASLLAFLLHAQAQYNAKPSAPIAMESKTESSIGGGMVKFDAILVAPDKKAAGHSASVQVTVAGINLVDPDEVGSKPRPGEGHLHYQLDNGPIIATTATKLSFHNLESGDHKIVVTLAGNDHKPISRDNTLTVKIP